MARYPHARHGFSLRDPIVIVGGGLSGLYAARLLQERGLDFLLLEARPALGGRIHSPGGHDLGPTWFWPDMQPRMARLVERLGLEAFPQHAAGDVLFERGPGVKAERHGGFNQMASSFRIRGGIGALTEALAAGLPRERLRTAMQVTAARLRDTGVTLSVRGADGATSDIAARRVLFALPPRILEQTIAFAPEPPADMRSRWQGTPTWMAPQAKFLALYARAFWREAGLSGTAQSMAGPMSEIHDACVTATGDGAALLKQPIYHVGVEDENHARDGLPQMHHRVFVVVAAAALRPVLMFVLAQKRSDLHTNLRLMIYDLRFRIVFEAHPTIWGPGPNGSTVSRTVPRTTRG